MRDGEVSYKSPESAGGCDADAANAVLTVTIPNCVPPLFCRYFSFLTVAILQVRGELLFLIIESFLAAQLNVKLG